MKKIALVRALAPLALVFAAAPVAGAAEPVPAATAPPKTLSIGQQKYNSVFPQNVPDAVLEPLKAEEGVWDADVELYVGDLAMQPIRKKGVQTNRLMSSGHAMLNDFKYSDGSYEGTGLWGWDAYNNRYTGTWIDSSTHLVRQDIGYYDPETKTFRWEADTIQNDGVATRMRIIQQFKGDVRTFQIDVMAARTGEYKKLIFMTFTRRPDAG